MDTNQIAIVTLLEKLTATSSRKEKEAALKEAFAQSTAATTKEAFTLALDPFVTFGVVVQEGTRLEHSVPTWQEFTALLDKLATRELTGNDAKEAAAKTVNTLSAQWNKWAARIINKDLRVGAGAKTINKAAGSEIVREFQLALCDKYDPNEEGADNTRSLFGDSHIIETKLDGWRCVVHCKGGKAIIYARSGKPIASTRFVEQELAALNLQDVVLDGELLARSFQETEKICGSDVTELPEELVKELKFRVWDVIPADYFFSQGKLGQCAPLGARKVQLAAITATFTQYCVEVPHEPFDSNNLNQYDKHLAAGHEGSIIKDATRPYGFGRTASGWYKVKPVLEVDCTVTGFEEGTGKHAGSLGALLVEGTVENKEKQVVPFKTKIGTGLSDELRAEIWAKRGEFLGRMVEAGYQDVSRQEGTDDWSLRFPRLRRLRTDRVGV